MKKIKDVKEYGSTLMSIVNQIKLLGGEFLHQRVVDKLLLTLSERYEILEFLLSKISKIDKS